MLEHIENVKNELLTTDLEDIRYRQGYAKALLNVLQTDIEESQ